jgi:putative membrane protein
MSEKNRDVVWVFALLIVLISVLLVTMVGLGGGYMSGMMGMMGYGWGSMVLILIAFLVLIAIGVYCLVTGSAGPSRSVSNRGGRALEILRERYAKGEITREQFLKMKRELES